jgi:predicted nucleic acid-binding protein
MLVDTSVLVRTLQPHHPLYPPADHAIRVLPGQGRKLHIVAQNLIEVWVVATRPLGENGLGMTLAEAATELGRIKGMFLFLAETAAIYPAWEALVLDHAVSGKSSHDARLVAAMLVHGLTAILTFDTTGFSRFPDIEVIHRAEVTAKAIGEEGY